MGEMRTILITSVALTLGVLPGAATPAEILPAEPSASPTNLRQISDDEVFGVKSREFGEMPRQSGGTAQLKTVWDLRKTADGGALAFERDVQLLGAADAGIHLGTPAKVNHRVVKEKGATREVVWESVTGYGGKLMDGMGPPFVFFDAVQCGEDVYVFYLKEHRLTVDKVAGRRGWPWRVVISLALTDFYRSFGVGQFYRDRNSGRLGIVYKGSPQKEDRWLGFEQLREANGPRVSLRADTSVQTSAIANDALSDGSGFSRRLSDPRVFKEELARVIDVGAPVNPGAGRNEPLFARKAVDGSTLKLEREPPFKRLTRIDSKTCEASETRYWLLRRTASEDQRVFLMDVTVYPGIPARPKFASVFWDAILVGDQMYVLYSDAFLPKVDVMARASKARKALGGANALDWVVVQSFVLAGSGHGGLAQFIRDRDTWQLGVIYKDSAAHEERWIGIDQVRPTPRGGDNQ